MQDTPVILGTAGHIDHGKTSLVKALTGIDTDRLKEEKARGITIELGFAYLDLGARRIGVVDVPGHERFIKTMVAGAGGVDIVLFVIAADEGIMPQTREHLDICQLLGIKSGVVALTKSDLVDPDWLALVTDEVRHALAGSFLAGAAIIPVSSATTSGLDALSKEIVRLSDLVTARSPEGVFRLPIDRVFTMHGFGTVVTGTILGGRVRGGDDVALLPGPLVGKVRGLQVHGAPVSEAVAGMRLAVNIGGVEHTETSRGQILARPGSVSVSHILDAKFHYLGTCKAPLGRRSSLLIQHTTAQLLASIVLVDREELLPGDEALVQLHLDAPIPALPGDHFIARGFAAQEHYGTTVGGGEILRALAAKVRRSSSAATSALKQIASADLSTRVALEVHSAGPAGLTKGSLQSRLGLPLHTLDDALTLLVNRGDLWGECDLFVHAELLAALETTALAALTHFHDNQPLRAGIPREELRSRLPRALSTRLFDSLIARLTERGLVIVEKDVVRRANHTHKPGSTSPLAEQITSAFAKWGLETTRPQDIPAEMGKPAPAVQAVLDILLRSGELVRIRPDYYVEKRILDDLRLKLRAHLEKHGNISPQEWKSLTGVTRKYSIPLAEHFDAEKLTLRVGDVRKLRS